MKQRLLLEGKKMAAVFFYLALFFGAFATYTRITLSEHGITYFRYGYGLVEALVLAKVVLIGDALRIGTRYADKPLIVPTLHKTVCFSALVLAFSVVEFVVGQLLHGKGMAEAIGNLLGPGKTEILLKLLVMFVAFIPMFALLEMARVMGEEGLYRLFFKRGPPADATPGSAPSSGKAAA